MGRKEILSSNKTVSIIICTVLLVSLCMPVVSQQNTKIENEYDSNNIEFLNEKIQNNDAIANPKVVNNIDNKKTIITYEKDENNIEKKISINNKENIEPCGLFENLHSNKIFSFILNIILYIKQKINDLLNIKSDSEDSEICEEETEGCNNDFWKIYLNEWYKYYPDQLIGDVFEFTSDFDILSDFNLIDALYFKGESSKSQPRAYTLNDEDFEKFILKSKLLLIQAVSAILNAAHPNVIYPISDVEIIESVNNAINSIDTNQIDILRNQLANYNSLRCDCESVPKCIPDVYVEKKVKYNCGGDYVDYLTIDYGDWVTFKLEIINTGDCILDIEVRDELPDGLTYDDNAYVDGIPTEPIIQPNGDLIWYLEEIMPQQTVIITFEAIGLECGEFENIVNVTGDTYCVYVYYEDNATVFVDCNEPDIELNKTVDPTCIIAGGTVDYTYVITNIGDFDLVNIVLTDDKVGGITLPQTTLAIGDSMTVTVEDVTILDDTLNTGNVTGEVIDFYIVWDEDTAFVDVINPSIYLNKSADKQEAYVGETITYTYYVENTGDVTLTNVNVVDTPLGPVTLGKTTLNTGEYTTGTLTYIVQLSDYPGPLVNTAIATGTPPCGYDVTDEDCESVDILICGQPGIELNKTVDPTCIIAGGTVDYTYVITNIGDFDLVNIVLTDDKLGGISLPQTTLAIGDSMTVTVEDVQLFVDTTNIGTVSGEVPDVGTATDQDDAYVDVINPDIEIIKTADVHLAQPGDIITYTYDVENIGDVTLTNVNVVDNLLGSVTLGTTTLSAGQTTTGQLTYVVEQSDLPGPIVNIAIATATPPCGCDVTDEDSETVILQSPCPPEVWVDDSWFSQIDVDSYNPSLIWGYDAFGVIQDGVDAVCECGTVYVRPGFYYGQVLISKSLALLGEPGAEIHGSALQTFTIDGSVTTYTPVIFAFAGTLVGNNVVSSGSFISVIVDGFEIYGSMSDIAVLYHNVQNGCVLNQISHNEIRGVLIGVQLNGCTADTKVIYNKMYWTDSGHTAVLITPFDGCEPSGLIINYNYWGAPCAINIGVDNQGSIIPDARFNWWSAEDGPSSLDTDNPNFDAVTGRIADGYGDRVIGPVYFDPWYGVDACAIVSHISGMKYSYNGAQSFAYDETGNINGNIEFLWDFGDGYYSDSCSGIHEFESPGTYDIILRVRVASYTLDTDFVSGFLYDWWYTTVVVT